MEKRDLARRVMGEGVGVVVRRARQVLNQLVQAAQRVVIIGNTLGAKSLVQLNLIYKQNILAKAEIRNNII